MKYTAKVTESGSGYAAECIEIDAIGEGTTRDAAIAALRGELEERLAYVEGVAPPSRPAHIAVDLVVVDESWEAASAPTSPGDPG